MKQTILEKYNLVNKQCFFWQPDKKRMKLLFSECEFYIEFNNKSKNNKHIYNFIYMRNMFNYLGFEDNVIILADEIEKYKKFVHFPEYIFDKNKRPIRVYGALTYILTTKEINQLKKEIQSVKTNEFFKELYTE